MSDQNQPGPNFSPINEQRQPYAGHPYQGHVPPGEVPGGPPPKPAKRKRFGFLAVTITAAAGIAVGAMFGAAGSSASSATTAALPAPAPTVTITAPGEPGGTKTVTAKPEPAPTVTVTAEPEQPAEESSVLGDGIWEVGVDVKAGRWKTIVPDDSRNCYWARHSDDSGEFESIISNGNADTGARVSITIKSGEFLELNGCGDAWKRS